MPYPLTVLPDGELAIIQYLSSVAEVTALCPAQKITTSLPAQPTWPHILVSLAGSQDTGNLFLSEPALQIDVFATGKREAQLLAQTVRAAIRAIANDSVPEAVLASGAVEVGPQWLPDNLSNPPVARYTARYRVLLHP